jgi:MoxR-like ATPase
MIDELAKRSAQLEQALFEMRRVVVGQSRVLERLMVALLAGGHTLLEGVPGLGKTLTLSTMARVLGGSFSRIQFTPDLLPSDIVGTRIFLASQEKFDVEPGPVLANFVLADEINRAPAKVQSAMLEVMAEGQVTIGDQTFPAPKPFLVMATQNPIESEGVYPLPEAQRDRFMMRVPVGYPDIDEEREIVHRMDVFASEAAPILDPSDVMAMQQATRAIFVDQKVVDYALRIVTATRRPHDVGMGQLDGLIEYGASPRASIALVRGAMAMAVLRGRGYALPQDVYEIAYDVLNHRLVLTYAALAEGVTVDDVLVELLSKLPAPRISVSEAHDRSSWDAPVPTRASSGVTPPPTPDLAAPSLPPMPSVAPQTPETGQAGPADPSPTGQPVTGQEMPTQTPYSPPPTAPPAGAVPPVGVDRPAGPPDGAPPAPAEPYRSEPPTLEHPPAPGAPAADEETGTAP